MKYSKKVKLPKFLWERGKSKFLFLRLREMYPTNYINKGIKDIIKGYLKAH